MENPQNRKDKVFEKFTWTITNFSTIDSKKLSSDTFYLDGHKWKITIYPKANKGKSLSIYLDHRCSFTLEQYYSGYRSYISLDELWNSSLGFIVNDTCIIEVHILVEDEKQIDESLRNIDNKLGELGDFKGIGKVKRDFIPLLEEVCSRYPSLIKNKKRKSQEFIEWAFTALGRVLHFLNTKKVRDMDHNACRYLQSLWEEVEIFGFDLSWLKPHVQSALDMETRVEKVLAMKRLEENVTQKLAILEMESKDSEMIEAKVDLVAARIDLEESFEQFDLDAELGYGKL
ncbi:MATH domain and coiled-coil domain-containing protein At3g58250-like [Vigna radiata var. radiata]|uniref:MATH domain and coiled-coil domain-containing protein At3g58250-like n=1 Tax=Vigna radiata var. radiata TaxID=3916 RepID=A0A3Q0FCC9_VIGRR|nr:MATH domain and coiled-coil domain-containing protein At3g58250-like [Vigna radiata var. radiata]